MKAIANFETAYLNAGGKVSELEKEDSEYVSSKAQMGWQMWQVANPRRSVTLTCAELLEAFEYGAPDGRSDKDQMETEMTIEWLENGHSGKGYYAYYSDLPEEGSIKLGEECVLETQEHSHE